MRVKKEMDRTMSDKQINWLRGKGVDLNFTHKMLMFKTLGLEFFENGIASACAFDKENDLDTNELLKVADLIREWEQLCHTN